MAIPLNPVQRRIMGSLIEKSLTTPDLYPLTMNALINACNQKSSRDPVMTLSGEQVAEGLAWLIQNQLVGQRNEPGSRVNKFFHRVETLLNGGSNAEVAAVGLLLLRGPQTLGEIKTRSERLYPFQSPEEVETVLAGLAERHGGDMVVRLPRQTGQKECRYKDLFSTDSKPETDLKTAAPPRHSDVVLKAAVAPTLEARLHAIEERLAALEQKFSDQREPSAG